ncbi:MAG TPA: hypothetical protein VM537_15750 [Anaerolineae bacterium]|nr:hypothetical protein [Anaerolineae bacterium]
MKKRELLQKNEEPEEEIEYLKMRVASLEARLCCRAMPAASRKEPAMAYITEVTNTRDLANIRADEGDTAIVYVEGDPSVEQLEWIRGQLAVVWPDVRVAVFPRRLMHVTVIGAKERCDAACCGDEAVQKGTCRDPDCSR